MTFDLHTAATAARDRARAAAASLAATAPGIDASAAVPAQARQQARAALAPASDRFAWVLGVEELAAVSASLAVDAALVSGTTGPADSAPSWMGLRGVDLAAARAAATGDAGDLAIAAVLVGLGRAALEAALAAMRTAKSGGGRPEQQQWTVADAATELEAARLLLWRAATASAAGDGAAAMARLQARAAADAAVRAAGRVLGANAGASGSALDRVTRDVATVTLVFGSADREEAAVADAVLPAAR